MNLVEIHQLQQACEGRMACEGCTEKRKCDEFRAVLANISEPWEVKRLIEDLGEYVNEEVR